MLETSDIISLRPERHEVRPDRPNHFLHEEETGPDGEIRKVNTIFLTNSECPFKCVMCDLWKNTTENPVKPGDIPRQITFALDRLPEAAVIKLYNSGNFFDRKAIPPGDYPEIARLLENCERIIIENHPKLCGEGCIEFSRMLNGKLEVAMGLETVHPEVLPKLNKQITTENFRSAVEFLTENGIASRAFILLNPPFLTDPEENIEWTVRSVAFAFECGVTACSIIPTRAGNGAMEKLQREGHYVPPAVEALEEAFDRALNLNGGRVFADLWDLEQFSDCPRCLEKRKARLEKMNEQQIILPRIECSCT